MQATLQRQAAWRLPSAPSPLQGAARPQATAQVPGKASAPSSPMSRSGRGCTEVPASLRAVGWGGRLQLQDPAPSQDRGFPAPGVSRHGHERWHLRAPRVRRCVTFSGRWGEFEDVSPRVLSPASWSLFTRSRGGPTSLLLQPWAPHSTVSYPGRDKGGCGRISFLSARWVPGVQLLRRPLPRLRLLQDALRIGLPPRALSWPALFPPRRAGPGQAELGAKSAAEGGEGARASVRFQAFVAGASCRWVNGAEEIGEGRQKRPLKEGVSAGQRDKGQNTHGRRGTDGDGRGKTIRPQVRGRGAAPSFSS